MKRYTNRSVRALLAVLLALLILTQSVAMARVAEDDGADTYRALGFDQGQSQPEGGAKSGTPTVADSPWGPPVGTKPTGETVRLAAPTISDRTAAPDGAILSDDFNTCTLNDFWTFVNPNPPGDGAYSLVGTFTQDAWLDLSVPANTDHDITPDANPAPRVMQSVDNTDFEIEAKFDSGLGPKYQMQGILVEQDEDNFLRLEFYSDDANTWFFAALFQPGVQETKYNQPVLGTLVAPLYMRVRRDANQWTLRYSQNGTDWSEPAVSFAQSLTVSKVGVYAANCCENWGPAQTAHVDYFFNNAAAIDPEDGDRNTLTVDIIGQGTVTKNPAGPDYTCNQQVTLTANPETNWDFGGWSGDLSGTENPAQVTMTGSKLITATFELGQYALTILDPIPPDKATMTPPVGVHYYDADEIVTLTVTPAEGYTVYEWLGANGDEVFPNPDGTWSIKMDGNKEVQARLRLEEFYIDLTIVGNGTVNYSPGPYYMDDTATLTPVPSTGWGFDGWTGPNGGELVKNPVGASWSLKMDGDKEITANFVRFTVYLPLVTR